MSNDTVPYQSVSKQTIPSQTKASVASLTCVDKWENRGCFSGINYELWFICYSFTMSVHIDKRATGVTSILNGIGQSYDGKFKLMVIKYAKKTSNATRKLVGMEANIW